MPLPKKAIDKLMGRSKPKTRGSYSRLLVLSGSLFIIVLILYGGMILGYVPYLDSRIGNLDSQIGALSDEVSAEEFEQVKGFYSQLASLDMLLASHVTITNAFDFLERTVHPSVFYTNASVNSLQNLISLVGVSSDTKSIIEQIALIEQHPDIKEVSVESISSEANGTVWRFNFSATMAPDRL